MKEQLLEQVNNLKAELLEVESRLRADIAAPVLDDFKSAIDHVRLSLLAISHSSGEERFEAAAAIVRSRLERAGDICKQIVSNIEARDIPADSPELKQLHETLSATVSRIHQLYKSGR